MQKCKICGKELKLVETQEKDYTFGGEKETVIRKLYECDNPKCDNYGQYSEPDCDHDFGNKDYGRYAFEHCYYCVKCGYFVCYDSSG